MMEYLPLIVFLVMFAGMFVLRMPIPTGMIVSCALYFITDGLCKGYGFIAGDEGGEDVFVHFSAINADGYRTLKEGQKVSYETEVDPKNPEKLRAINVTVIE